MQASRQAIIDYLSGLPNYSVRDSSGRATAQLIQAVDYKGTASGISQLLGNMEKAGQIARTMNGKRCYSIELGEGYKPSASSEPPASPPQTDPNQAEFSSNGIDYAQLSEHLLKRVISLATQPTGDELTLQSQRDLAEARERLGGALEQAEKYRGEVRDLEEDKRALELRLQAATQRLSEIEVINGKLLKGAQQASKAGLVSDRERRDLERLVSSIPVGPGVRSA